ncbi:hypothetical protein DWG18_11130 [Lysobacter sp. TY2-98]|uniref:hypothetical protein n=1 Tax=Lysobacter sp. TY2-98 TaxID=2290922 RepID=UPI000E1FD206|nr:hypothetical protein [Lysobacter sp. TY2-98]AXK72776.1 hypothetical protein DWG18_11130 [Lysobacter sp. TY2-98]
MQRLLVPAALVLFATACAHAPGATSSGNAIEGRVTALDTAPWAYDGSGTLTVDAGTRTVRVSLPARWNLCKGRGLDRVGDLKVGDRVRVTGTAGDDGTVDACSDPNGSIEKL